MTGNYKDVIVSTDTYKATYVKALECKRKGISEKVIVKGSSTKKPHDWKGFLSNTDNKEHLVQLMLTCWPEFAKGDRKLILLKNG